MTLPRQNSLPAPPFDVDYKRVQFRRLCADIWSSDPITRSRAEFQLNALPLDQAQNFLIPLWESEEPDRRCWEQRRTVFQGAARLWLCAATVLFPLAGIFWLFGVRLVWPCLLLPCAGWYYGTYFAAISSGNIPSDAQRGGLMLLARLPLPALTGLWIDTLDFHEGSADFATKNQRYALLADLLSQSATSDLAPLDTYQQKVLLREGNALLQRLRQPSARISNAEAGFVVATVRYLSTRHEPQLTAPTVRLIQKLAALTPGKGETANRRQVREAASDCLLWCH